MTRLKAISPENATGKTSPLFNGIENRLGMVPNMMRTMGNSATLLESYLNLSALLNTGNLGARTGELIALAVAESNCCNYCLSAHTYIGANLLKIDNQELGLAREGKSADVKTDAVLKFAKTVVSKKGMVNDADVEAIKSAGVTEGEVAEIIGFVALNILTNYFNNTANTEIDFPVVTANK